MIWAKKRFSVLERDDFRCQYCWKTWKDVSLEVDHIIPKSKWWNDELDNLITCCRECNIGKWDDIIWVNINIGKFKIAEHEKRSLKQFFNTWNELRNGTIDKDNVSFISWFIKFYYWECLKSFIDEEIKNWNITKQEFDEWWDKCEKLLKEFYDLYIASEIEYIFDNLENSTSENYSEWTRATDDYNERLNWLITYSMSICRFSKPFIYKYSMCPNKVDERWGEEE